MDFYRNLSVVTGGDGGNGGFPSSEYSPEEQLVVSPSSTTYSKLGVVSSSCCSVDDLFSTQNMEQEAGDVNIEWLSNLVEDCLSNTGNCTYQPLPMNDHQPLNAKKHYSSVSFIDDHKIENTHHNQNQSTTPAPQSLQNFISIPTGNTRTKRKRTTKLPRKPSSGSLRSSTSNNNSSGSSWSSHQEEKDPQNQNPNHHVVMTTTSEYMTPLLVHQAYWLADSELINVPQNENTNNTTTTFTTTTTTMDNEDDEQEEIMMKMEVEEEEEEESRRKDSLGNLGQPRRCAHCLSQKTPQWRAGPLGPKTLCNACGVRFKSGRLLPEYRPAKSPTFVSYKHSNSHKKVLEMRMSILPSSIHSE